MQLTWQKLQLTLDSVQLTMDGIEACDPLNYNDDKNRFRWGGF
jgi:hypothetical protein